MVCGQPDGSKQGQMSSPYKRQWISLLMQTAM